MSFPFEAGTRAVTPSKVTTTLSSLKGVPRTLLHVTSLHINGFFLPSRKRRRKVFGASLTRGYAIQGLGRSLFSGLKEAI